jgi:arylsulfatase A-like enzyme
MQRYLGFWRPWRSPWCSPRRRGQEKKTNILVIRGDDVGWFNVGAHHRGLMSGKTPNLDKLAAEGVMFTDYYAEASCTASRAAFITGEIPLRTGLTTVGQAGADVGLPEQASTIATALKALGYETYQFGKNHLGDKNKYLPCVHGFDEFFGYLYHLDAMSDPYWFDYPQDWIDKPGRATWCTAGPRAMTTPPTNRAGAKSANKKSTMKVRCLHSRI